MEKRGVGKHFGGAELTSKILGLCIQKPCSVKELTEEIYQQVKENNNTTGRIYSCIEALIETGALKPVMSGKKLTFAFTGFKS